MNSALHKRHLVHQDSLNGESQNGQSCRNIGEASHDNHEISLSQKHQQQRRRRKRQMKYTLWRSYSIHNGASGINSNGNIVLFAFATCFFLICIVLIISLPHLHRRKHHPFHAGVNSLLHKKNSKSDLAVSSAFSQNSNNESAKVSNERDENHYLRKPPEKYDPQQNQNQPNNSQLSQRKQSNQSNNPTEALLKCHDYGCAIYPMELSQIIKSMSNTGITHSTSTVNHSSPSAYLASKHHVMITHQSNRMKPRPVNQDRVLFISPFDILDYGNFPNAMEQRKILDGGISLQSAAYSDNTEKDNQQKSENDNSKLSSRRSSKQQTFVPTVNPRDNFFLGVFDGHGDEGEVIAQFSSEEIPSRIVSKLRSDNIPSIGNDIHKRNVPNSEGNNKSGNDHNDIPKVHPNINNDVNSLISNDAILKLGKQSEDEQETVKQAIIQSFVETDRDSPEKEAMTGGCTATTILRIGNTLYMANTGDSTSFIVLYTPPPGGIQFNATTVNQNKEDPKDKNIYNNNLNMNHNQIVQHLQTPIQGSITIHHQNRRDKPHLPDEMARIKQLGGRIHIPPKHPMGSRVVVRSSVHKEDIGLAMSRSIGDWEWGKVGVIPDPIVEVVDLKSLLLENGGGGAEEGSVKMFVVAGSDGLFDARKVEFVAKNLARGFFESIPDGIDDSGNWNDLQRRYNAHGLKVARELVTAASPMKPEMYRDDISFVSMVVEIDDSIQ